jgi:hypothetical protein
MPEFFDAIVTKSVNAALRLALLQEPAWTRLEPQSITGDPTPGLAAAVYDPLWLMYRQWQMGEYVGENTGSPLLVHVNGEATPVTAWQPGDPSSRRPAQPLSPELPIDPFIEREATPPEALGLRQRAEAGAHLLELLTEAGFRSTARLLSECPLDPPASIDPPEHSALTPALALLQRTMPDGAKAAAQMESDTATWLESSTAKAKEAANAWLQWYRGSVAPLTTDAQESWLPDRLEYRFSLRVGTAAEQKVLRAPEHLGGTVDWHSFRLDPRGNITLPTETRVAATPVKTTVFSTPLRYSGMPASRYWQFEDGQVNFGKIETQVFDLARMCLAEFALVYANDWLAVPIDVPAGSFTQLREVAYTNTFGERFVAKEADDASRAGRFRLFRTSVVNSEESVAGLLNPPSALAAFEGRALEDVYFVRDEQANMVWAIESFVQGASGDPRNRFDEERPTNAIAEMEAEAEFQYLLQSAVPKHWIPFVPVAGSTPGSFHLRKGSLHEEDSALGALLRSTPYDLFDEETPREGVRVRRVPVLARAADGRYLRWICRRISTGRGEGSSGLVYDAALKP